MNLDRDALFIGGEWTAPASAELLEVISPHSEEVVATVPQGTTADIDAAVVEAPRPGERHEASLPEAVAHARLRQLREPAQRVHAEPVEHAGQLAVAVPSLRVIEDDLLVEGVEGGAHRSDPSTPKYARTPATPSRRRSTSASVLNRYVLARVVAATCAAE